MNGYVIIRFSIASVFFSQKLLAWMSTTVLLIPKGFSGVYRVLISLASGLDEHDHAAHIFTLQPL